MSAITLRLSVATDEDLIWLRYKLGRSFQSVITECMYAYLHNINYQISLAAMTGTIPEDYGDIRINYIPRNPEIQEYLDSVGERKKSMLIKFVLRRSMPADPAFYQMSPEDREIREKEKELQALRKKRTGKKNDTSRSPIKKEDTSKIKPEKASIPPANLEPTARKTSGSAVFGMASNMFKEY